MNAKRGFRQKRLFAKISVDRRRNKDLDSLKAMGAWWGLLQLQQKWMPIIYRALTLKTNQRYNDCRPTLN